MFSCLSTSARVIVLQRPLKTDIKDAFSLIVFCICFTVKILVLYICHLILDRRLVCGDETCTQDCGGHQQECNTQGHCDCAGREYSTNTRMCTLNTHIHTKYTHIHTKYTHIHTKYTHTHTKYTPEYTPNTRMYTPNTRIYTLNTHIHTSNTRPSTHQIYACTH
jgi:hypothetical protein